MPLMTAIRQLHTEIQLLRDTVNLLREEVKTIEQPVQLVLNDLAHTESESETDGDSVHSAPATVSSHNM